MADEVVQAGHLWFETALGRCGLAWGNEGIRAVRLPGDERDGTLASLQSFGPRCAGPEAAPAWVAAGVAKLRAHLSGQLQDLSTVPLDLTALPPFARRVCELARQIPAGERLSYGELAARCGSPRAARAVGQAMARNPCVLLVPCHRVVAADGRLTGFSAAGGLATKARLLKLEETGTSSR